MSTPDFFLKSSEGYGLDVPRACFRRARLGGRAADDYLVVDIDPPLPGESFGRPGQAIRVLVLATRHAGRTLFPVNEWPLYVHVAIPTRELLQQTELSADDLDHVAWAEIYRTIDDAIAEKA